MTSIEVAVREHRDALIGVAYRMLGTVTDAQDAVQEAFLRLERTGTADIDNVGGWLNRTTSRICLDRLTSARARRAFYVGPWLPEPLATDADPTDPVELAESVSMAFLVVLESLSPAERVAFVLHDVFGYDHAEVADRFLDACRTGDVAALLDTLAPDVVLTSDGGGKVSAARRPIHGAERVLRFLDGLNRQAGDDLVRATRWFNGTPGLRVTTNAGHILVAFVLDIADGTMHSIEAIRNPDKLAHLG